MLSKEIIALPIDYIASNLDAFVAKEMGSLGGRKFNFLNQDGAKYEFCMRDMLNYLNSIIDAKKIPTPDITEEKNAVRKQKTFMYNSLVKKLELLDKEYEVTCEKYGFLKYFLTLIRRIANIGFNKKNSFEKLLKKTDFEIDP